MRATNILLIISIVMGIIIISDVLVASDDPDIVEEFDANMMRAFDSVDVNVMKSVSDSNISDPDINKFTVYMVSGFIEIFKGGLYLGVYVGKQNPELFALLSLPIVIWLVCSVSGIPFFDLFFVLVYLVYERTLKRWRK